MRFSSAVLHNKGNMSFSNNRGRFGAQRASRPSYQFSRRAPQRGGGFSHSRYINVAVEPEHEEPVVAEHAFSDFGLHEQLLANITKHGYTQPTPIQDQAIPALMEGRDVVGVANTGTGKTAAFLLPLIHKVLNDPTQGCLILAPTRELALQIHEEFRIFAAQLPVSCTLCIGGASLYNQVQQLRDNPHFVIGTPGRIKDLINRRAFKTDMFTNIVLDEVDRMLDIGFRKDIQFLIAQLPPEHHAAFFSATMNFDTENIMKSLMTDPVRITIKKQESSQHINQDIIRVKAGENKIVVLHQLLLQEDFSKVIVFGRTKHGINKLEEQLSSMGIRVSSIHGNKNQGARQRSLQEFKRGRVQALLATDIAARGIDVEGVTHVINFDEPQSYEDYIHRIGRTGRAGKYGKALTFVN